MPKITHTLPLVFALAVAIESGTDGAQMPDAGTVFEPGSLAQLLRTFQRSSPDHPTLPPSGVEGQFDQAQWGNFPNFFNCFSGNWRNC